MTTKEKVYIILNEHPSYNIQALCDDLGIARPTYYQRMRVENWKSLEVKRINDIYFLLKNLSDSELNNLSKVIKHKKRMIPEKNAIKNNDPIKSLFDQLKGE